MSYLNSITCWTDCGEMWSTSVNGGLSEREAIAYFLGQTFNIGPCYINDRYKEDHMVLVTAVQFRKGVDHGILG